ncbi:HoxN/HupN/NixA family nickel/cobalt transporter [Nevskia ramosa]|uniref:HoxN/HupN/NixA family nickel/cobalt transporter n=1 Tax=Nevskia ramosa TaxID=64002 RepID=UPI003D0CA326
MLKAAFSDASGGQRSKLVALFALLIGLNITVWALTLAVFQGNTALLGTALLAYVFGLRHAVDADHIAAIDNVVRKLMQEGKRPLTVGFWFSLGHSSLIIIAVGAIVLAASAMQARMDGYREIGSILSTCVSGFFLMLIAVTNLVILKGVWKSFLRVRAGETVDDDDLDLLLAGRGLLARIFRPLFRLVSKSWHMAAVGFLFGLGFDTATEIALFGIAATHASDGIPLWSAMLFPALFTAGMVLIDTADSVLMVGAYGWAFNHPVRKLWYNLTITSVSILVAVIIGGIEVIGLLATKLDLPASIRAVVDQLDAGLENIGFIVIGVFIGSWLLSAAIYRWKRYDELPVRRTA